MTDIIQQFINAIAASGLPPPEEIIPGPKFQHFSTNGKKGDTSGWYRLHLDGIPAGSFGCYRSGIIKTWCSKSRNEMTSDEWASHVRVLESMAKQKEEDAQNKASKASIEAQEIWSNAKPADDNHPYLLAKSVKSCGLKVEGDNLLLSIYNLARKTITSLQTISPSGEKRFMLGGVKRAGFFQITSEDSPKDKVVICEGYATGASIFEATGLTVAVAFDSGNLLPVAQAIRVTRPELKLIIAADDDWKSDINIGLTKAKEAAQKVGGSLVIPNFLNNRNDKDSDFNDLARMYWS
jgi:putative DNA primase/helicase